ncbi:MAG: helix-turn-helix transcriptional regulator [Fimbriimonadales bacterium]
MAARAAYSRSHFSRLFANGVGETPRILRRRLQLEAAAHLLTRTRFGVGEIAVEVGYATPEAFAKAFKTAYGVSPRQFRAEGAENLRLETKSGIHFHPSGLIRGRRRGTDGFGVCRRPLRPARALSIRRGACAHSHVLGLPSAARICRVDPNGPRHRLRRPITWSRGERVGTAGC